MENIIIKKEKIGNITTIKEKDRLCYLNERYEIIVTKINSVYWLSIYNTDIDNGLIDPIIKTYYYDKYGLMNALEKGIDSYMNEKIKIREKDIKLA